MSDHPNRKYPQPLPGLCRKGCIFFPQTSATLRRTKCQLRLILSGMPSRISLSRHWISSPLRTRFDRLRKEYTPLDGSGTCFLSLGIKVSQYNFTPPIFHTFLLTAYVPVFADSTDTNLFPALHFVTFSIYSKKRQTYNVTSKIINNFFSRN